MHTQPAADLFGDCGGFVWFAVGFCEANGQEAVGADSISARGVLRQRKIPRNFHPCPQSHTSLKIFGAKSTTFFFAVQERFLQKVLYFVRECGTIFLIYKIHCTFKKL